jgi:hypothetical protein
MKRYGTWMTGVAVAAALAAGCGEDGGQRGISPTGPRLLVGPTVTVIVSCPAQMETGTSGTCTAFGYDGNGTFTGSSVSSWSSSNTSLATIGSSGNISAVAVGSVTITAVIDGVSGSTSVSVVNPPPTLTVSISGPSSIRPNTTCEWLGTESGGTPGYTYDWSGGTTIYEDGSNYYLARSSEAFYVSVTVTDATGHTASASKYVTVSSKASACIL